MFQGGGCTRVFPNVADGITHFRIERGIGVGIDVVIGEEFDELLGFGAGGFKVELVVGAYERSGALHQVLIDS